MWWHFWWIIWRVNSCKRIKSSSFIVDIIVKTKTYKSGVFLDARDLYIYLYRIKTPSLNLHKQFNRSLRYYFSVSRVWKRCDIRPIEPFLRFKVLTNSV